MEDYYIMVEGVRILTNAVMELEITTQVGVPLYGRGLKRTTYRNGYKQLDWKTRIGIVPLRVPMIRSGYYSPVFIKEGNKGEDAILLVVHNAYRNNGVSGTEVQNLLKSLGIQSTHDDVRKILRALNSAMKAPITGTVLA